jgi:solute carrier family 41
MLEFAIRKFSHLAIYQPVVNGVGGNLVALLASRLSTILYKTEKPGKWASWAPNSCIKFPFEAFFGKKSK